MTEKSFYRAFEDRHRGSRDLIKSRLTAYKQFIEPLLPVEKNPHAIDLGCGRGEWLEVLGEMGVAATGVDLDQGMLAACAERGLVGIHADAIEYLHSLESESQLVVSAFHVVEHISFEDLQRLTKEAHRVLRPGGLLIMETPNPENIFVATCNFYLDPTHVKPIPPELLVFSTEYCGFLRSKIVRLQESPQVLQSHSLTLNDVLGGASPDYAVVAQKMATQEVYSLCDKVFDQKYGINSINLAARYSDQLEKKIEQIRISVENTNLVIQSIYSSKSWKLTEPLRWAGSQARKLKQGGIANRSKALVKIGLLNTPILSSILGGNDSKARKAIIFVGRYMGIYAVLRKYYLMMGGKPNSPRSEDRSLKQSVTSLDDLSPNAKKVYIRLTEEGSIPEDKA